MQSDLNGWELKIFRICILKLSSLETHKNWIIKAYIHFYKTQADRFRISKAVTKVILNKTHFCIKLGLTLVINYFLSITN